MTDAELVALLQDPESDRVERKASLSDREKIREAICAFANDLPNHGKPGVIFVGVRDNGECANLTVSDELLRSLADMRGDGNILPFPTMIVQKRTLDGCELAVVIVYPSDDPPVRCRGRVWVRIGPRRAIATAEEERRLSEKRLFKAVTFDIRPAAGARLEDLDLDIFRRQYLPAAVGEDTVAQNVRSVEDQLAALRLAVPGSGGHPTNLGILVVGKNPRLHLPGAYVQFVRFDGTSVTDAIKDEKELDGPIPELVASLEELFKVHVSVSLNVETGPVAVERPDYPIVALRQIAMNAILHRTYEGTNAPVRIHWFADRVEISSPGGPYGQVTRETFGRPGVTDYRNPHLAEAMKHLNFVQRFGIGIELARRELQKNGNPELEFQVEDTYVLAVLRRAQ
jgi:ATP-dependent DNA helicase RecG